MKFSFRLLTLLALLSPIPAHTQTTPLVPDPLTLPTPRPASPGAYQYGVEMLKLDRAWEITKGRAHVSIVDSGIVAHAELTPGIDGNFRTHLSQTVKQPNPSPNFFHGTMVAGVLAARGFNGIGLSGACAWCSLSIHSGNPSTINVETDGATTDAIASGTTVINMSFGGPDGACPAINASICGALRRAEERDVVIVAATGNSSEDRITLPASYPTVIAVGGIGYDGNLWSDGYGSNNTGSNWGPKMRLVAPSKDVLVLQQKDKYLYDSVALRCGDRVDAPNGQAPTLPVSYTGYGDCLGTSFAAPWVTGIVGLIRSANPLLAAQQVRDILNDTATIPVAGPLGSGLTFYLPDAERAVQSALGAGARNRTSPLFAMYAEQTQTHLFTSSPQAAVAAVAGELKLGGQSTTSKFSSFGDTITGYPQFSGKLCDNDGNNCVQPAARALFNVFTTENSPDNVHALAPLYRMSQVCTSGAAGCKAVRTFAYASSRTQVQALEAKGYMIDVVEGYIYSPASAPASAVMLCLGFDATRIDYILYAAASCNRTQLANSAGANTGGNYQPAGTLGFVPSTTTAAPVNYTDIWFNPAESGWGIHITQHAQQLFGAWFTYDEQGNQLFITMPGCTLQAFDGTTCKGDLYRTTGPSYKAPVFDPSLVKVTKIGDGTISFSAQDSGTFSYRIGNTTLTKSIQRQPFGSSARSNYPNDLSDHFYLPDASGWGVAIAEHGNKSFTVIYDYDLSGNPMFITLPDSTSSNNTQTGKLYRTRSKGSHYLSATWNPADIEVSEVGSGTLKASGAQLDFQFTIDGYTQQRLMTRLGF